MSSTQIIDNAIKYCDLGKEIYATAAQIKEIGDTRGDQFESIEDTFDLIDKLTDLKTSLLELQ